MPVTLNDIAKAAGVSIGTVERALKGYGRVNKNTEEKIKKIAEEMNYRPNRIARGLVKGQREYRIGVILHLSKLNEFYSHIYDGIERAAAEMRDFGFSFTYYFCEDFDDIAQLSSINRAVDESMDALIIVPINSALIADRVKELIEANIPVVFLGSDIDQVPVLSAIQCDHFRSGRIGGHLISHISPKDAKLLIVLPPGRMRGNSFRRDGLISYLSAQDGFDESRLVIPTFTNRRESDLPKLIETLRDREIKGFIYNGDISIAIEALHEAGRQITTVTYDLFEDTRRALLCGDIEAVVSTPIEEQGYMAANTILLYVTEHIVPPRNQLVTSQIIVRECVD